MRKSSKTRQRGKRIILLALSLPAIGLVLWGLLALAGPGHRQPGAGYTAGTLVESSSLRRNNIYDRDFNLMAVSFRLSSLYARPLEVVDPEHTAAELAGLLALDQDELRDSLRSERSFVWLVRQAEKAKVEEVLARGLAGIHAMPRSHRYYPHHQGAAHAIGFVKDEQGLAGIELSYDNILRGGISDLRLAAAGVPEEVTIGGGVHLVSTLDLSLQRQLEQRLQRVLRTVDGSAAAALVMEVDSGAVVAMVSLPAYDPNRFWAAGAEDRLNRAVVPQVRPGGLRDIFQSAAALAGVEGEELLNLVGLCQASDLDLLEGRSLDEVMRVDGGGESDCQQLLADHRVTVSGVSLLAAFGRLINGGQPLEPHLIRGFWDGEQFWPRQSAVTGAAPSAAAGRSMLGHLAAMADGTGAVATYETLVAQAPAAMVYPLPPELAGAGGQAPPDGSVARGEPEENGEFEPHRSPRRYQAVQLSMAPADHPTLAALVFLDRARLDPDLPSPLATVSRDLDAWSAGLRRSPGQPSAEAMLAREEDLYRQWLDRREKGELPIHATVGRTPEKMPDVQGLSLRKALQVLQASGLRLQVSGSGRVVAQQPPPGTSLRGVDEGVIKLRELRVAPDELAAARP